MDPIARAIMMSPHVLTIPLCISLLALIISIRGYWRKTGVLIRGSFSTTSSSYCNDRYVSEITLENLKDRAITIFAIYLKVNPNYFIELEDMEAKPLVLKPFETYHRSFGPIEFYSVSAKRIDLRSVMDDKTIKKQLVLSTSHGRYNVASRIGRWTPITMFFANHLTAVVKTVRSTYKGETIGSNIAYVLELTGNGGKEEIIQLQVDDYQLKLFKNFSLTKESLACKENLEAFLQKQTEEGNMTSVSFKVFDLKAWRRDTHEFYSSQIVQGRKFSKFEYYVLGRLRTFSLNRQLAKKNKATMQTQKSSIQIRPQQDDNRKEPLV